MILGKLLLTFGVLLGAPLWQLYTLRKERLRRSKGTGSPVASAVSNARPMRSG
ncbi:hypothetical protein [Lentisalinibacter sediminis]